MVRSPEAVAVISEKYYPRESAQDVMPEQLANLLARHRVFVWRLSAIFALMDDTDTIEAEHIRQVYRCLDYSIDSIRYLLNTARQEAEQEEHIILGDKIYEFLLTYNGGKGCSLTEINKVLFGGNKRSKDIKPALKYLTECVPAKVECYQPEKQGRGKRETIFRPLVRN